MRLKFGNSGHKPILNGICKSLKPGGTLLVQLRGKRNAAEIFKIVDLMLENKKWSPYFRDFVFPFGFYGPEEYGEWRELPTLPDGEEGASYEYFNHRLRFSKNLSSS